MAHLTLDERIVIYQMRLSGETQKEIATALGRSPSTICRELQRNGSLRCYLPHQANQVACKRQRRPSVVSKLEEPRLYQAVTEKLRENYSPEQISGYLKRETKDLRISHQTIYRFLYGLDRKHAFRLAMRRGGRRNRREKPGFIKRQLLNQVSIHSRPKSVEKRNVSERLKRAS